MLGSCVGVDLGTTSVLIYVKGKGIVVNEPCVAAYSTQDNRLLALGSRALEMLGRTPGSIHVVRPISGGLISDFTATSHILRSFLSQVCRNMVFKPNVVVSVPSGLTKLEQRTLLDLVTTAGAAKACLIEEPLAAALGSQVNIKRPSGTMIVNIGGGTTDIAVITMGTVSISRSIRTAGRALDEAIIRYFKRKRGVQFGERTAEEIKKEIGCAYAREADLAIPAKGKRLSDGLPVRIEVSSSEVYSAIRDTLDIISDAITDILRVTPPELAADIAENGIILTGGGALLTGLDEMLITDLGVLTRVADSPIETVAIGAGLAMKDIDILISNGYSFQTREDVTGYRE